LILIVLLIPLTTAATEPPKVLTLKEALQTAWDNNSSLIKAANQSETAQLDLQLARRSLLPDLSASASTNLSESKSYNPQTNITTGESSQGVNASLRSQLNLFNGFKDVNSIKRAGLERSMSDLYLSQAQLSLVQQVIAQYINVIIATENIGIEEENLNAQRSLLSRVEAMYEAGSVSQTDVLQQKADIAQAELKLLSAQRSYRAGKLSLTQVMGVSPGFDFTIHAPRLDAILPVMSRWADSLAFSGNLTDTPDLQAQRLAVKVSRLQLRIARGGALPSASASVTYGTSYSDRTEALDFARQFWDVNPSLSAGLSLSLPVFDRSVVAAGAQKAKLQLRNEELALRDLELNRQLQLKQAFLDWETAVKQRQAAAAQADFAAQSLEAVQARYELGAANYTELSQSRAKNVQAAVDLLLAEWNLTLKFLDIAYLGGGLRETANLLTAEK